MRGLSLGGVVFSKFLPLLREQRRVRDREAGWVHAGWGKGGTNGSGLQWCLRHGTLSVGRQVSATLFLIYRGGDVLSALCDFGTYLSVGKCSVAGILGRGRRENVCMTLVIMLGVCV